MHSSPDLKVWTKHARILTTNEVTGRGAACGTDAHEKDGKYYLFFGANDAYPVGGRREEDGEPQPEPGISKYGGIGVAVADRPEAVPRFDRQASIDRF